MKVVITGGHFTPAIAVASQIKKIKPTAEIYFFGRKKSIEGDKSLSFEFLEVKKSSIPFFEIPAGRWQRKITKYSFFALVKIFPGFLKSVFLLKKIQPNLVLSFGGYLALPVALAAFVLRIPIIAHEQSPNLGLANKIIFKIAKLKGVSEKRLAQALKNSSVLFTGPLLREEIFKTTPASKELTDFLLRVGSKKLIYVTGGATGSHFLNKLVGETLDKILKTSFVIHQTGNLFKSRDFKRLNELKKRLPQQLSDRYFLTEFVDSQDVGAVLSGANLVISRSGANTTSELTARGKVALIIPLEWGSEQKEIAKKFSEAGLGLSIPQVDLTSEKFLKGIKTVFQNYDEYSQKAKALEKSIPTRGANTFAKKILAEYGKKS